MISVCIVNFNEGKNLKTCLESIADFVSEVVVIDLGSTDDSKQVVQQFNGNFFTHEFVTYVELIRNYAIDKTSGDWILVLDPDEIVSSQLKEKLKEITKQQNYSAVSIPRKNIFFDKWISHTNWWPDRHIRFFKKGKVRWDDKIHSYPNVEGVVYELPAREELAIIHHGYKTIGQFISRQNRYCEIEAKHLFDQGIRFSLSLFLWKPTREFLVRFIRHAGFLDGFHGFVLTYLMIVYQLQVMIKIWELGRLKK